MPARRRTARRRTRTAGGSPPASVLDPDGRIPYTGPQAEPFLGWLRDTHPEIDALDDLLVGALLDDLADRPAVEVVAHYCKPSAHMPRKDPSA